MGLLKTLGQGISLLGKGASFIPGIGNVAGGVLGAAGGLAEGKGLKGALSGAALNLVPGGGALGAVKGASKLAKVGGFLKNNIGNIATAASGIGSLIHGNKQQGRADKLQNQSLDFARQRYAEGAPLRSLGMSRLQNTRRPDLTAIYRNAQNPFSSDVARPQSPAGPLPSLGGGPDMGQPPIGPQGAPQGQGLPPFDPTLGGRRRLPSLMQRDFA